MGVADLTGEAAPANRSRSAATSRLTHSVSGLARVGCSTAAASVAHYYLAPRHARSTAQRFSACRAQPAHGQAHYQPELASVWVLIEWPANTAAPTKYWFSNLPEGVSWRRLVRLAKLRWRVEQNYQQLKEELGLDHYEGRGWH